MSESKTGWGILGTGMIANVFAEFLPQSQHGQLIAVGSRSQATADAFGEKYSIPNRHDSYEAVLNDPEVQAVYISLPNSLHKEWTIKCAQAGKHVLCEKPLAVNAAEAQEMIEVCQQAGVTLMEAFMYRCHPMYVDVVEQIRSGAIGEVRMIQSAFAFNGNHNLDNIRWQLEAAGGSIMDVGCYPISGARLIAGAALGLNCGANPIEVVGQGVFHEDCPVDNWATGLLRFENNILASVSCGTDVGTPAKIHVFGTQGSIEIDNPWFPSRDGSPVRYNMFLNNKKEEKLGRSMVPLYALEADVLSEAVARGDQQAPFPAMTWEDTLGNMHTLDQWRAAVGLKFAQDSDA